MALKTSQDTSHYRLLFMPLGKDLTISFEVKRGYFNAFEETVVEYKQLAIRGK